MIINFGSQAVCYRAIHRHCKLLSEALQLIVLGRIRRCCKPNNRCEFICSCGRIYKYRRNLTRHKKYECGVSPQFQCEVCYKQFKYKNELKAHMGFVHKFVTEIGP